jgi:hypothetical protein
LRIVVPVKVRKAAEAEVESVPDMLLRLAPDLPDGDAPAESLVSEAQIEALATAARVDLDRAERAGTEAGPLDPPPEGIVGEGELDPPSSQAIGDAQKIERCLLTPLATDGGLR